MSEQKNNQQAQPEQDLNQQRKAFVVAAVNERALFIMTDKGASA